MSEQSAAQLLASFQSIASQEAFYSCVLPKFGAVKIKRISTRTRFELKAIADDAARMAAGLAHCLHDAQGQRIFNPDDPEHIAMLMDAPDAVIDPILVALAEANGLGEKAEGIALKN